VTDQPDFAVEVHQNEFLPEGGRAADAIVTVSSSGRARMGVSRDPSRAEVIIIDTSGSMGYPNTKLNAAKQATITAIDTLKDGTAFAVVAGSHEARMIYPSTQQLVLASPNTRADAKAALHRLKADGGTAMGSWLRLASRLFNSPLAVDAIRHAILLTDGNNQHETPEQLTIALSEVNGGFTCDCRGIGTDWKVAELRRISTTMLGTVDIVGDPSALEADFRAMATTSMSKEIADVALRLWTPQGAGVRFVKQVVPNVADLTAKRTESGPRTGDYPTGSWGAESRDYHVSVDLDPFGVGEERLAARVMLVLPGTGEVLAQGLVKAVWTDDEGLSTRINTHVAHYTGQAEIAENIQLGLEARRSGDVGTATARLGRARRLAADSGNTAMVERLDKVVEVEDPSTGTVRLKRHVDDVDEMRLDTGSTKTVRVGKSRS
jgi:hypothetical protein